MCFACIFTAKMSILAKNLWGIPYIHIYIYILYICICIPRIFPLYSSICLHVLRRRRHQQTLQPHRPGGAPELRGLRGAAHGAAPVRAPRPRGVGGGGWGGGFGGCGFAGGAVITGDSCLGMNHMSTSRQTAVAVVYLRKSDRQKREPETSQWASIFCWFAKPIRKHPKKGRLKTNLDTPSETSQFAGFPIWRQTHFVSA